MQDFLKIRAVLYRLISKVYYQESTIEYLNKVYKYLPIFRNLGETVNNTEMIQVIDDLEQTLSVVNDGTIDCHEKLFARIFLSTGFALNKRSVIPVESVYLSGKRLVMQENRDQVMEFYCEQGLARNNTFKDSEDHISAELYFMAAMSEKTADAVDNHQEYVKLLDTQIKFLEQHLLKWAELVSDDIEKLTSELENSKYFAQMSKLITFFISADYSILAALAQEES